MELFWVILLAIGMVVLGFIPLIGFFAGLIFSFIAIFELDVLNDPVSASIITTAVIAAEVLMYIQFYNRLGFGKNEEAGFYLASGLFVYAILLGMIISNFFGMIELIVYIIIYTVLFLIPPWLSKERCLEIGKFDLCYGPHGLSAKKWYVDEDY